MRPQFARFAHWASNAVGTPTAFILSVLVVAVWAATGPLFRWSDSHQLVINTGTTIITFWLVFLIQATQNRQETAIQKKLDELIRVNERARDELIGAEEKEEDGAED